jgi:hypothetical protein
MGGIRLLSVECFAIRRSSRIVCWRCRVTQAFLLLPDLALFLVLYRMAGVGLHRTRTGMFVFLSAWLLFSVALVIVSSPSPVHTVLFARIFRFGLLACSMICAPALLSAADRIDRLPRDWRIAVAPILIFSFVIILNIHSWTTKPFYLCAWVAVVFLIASFGAGEPDATLWRGVGAFLLVFGVGSLLVYRFRGSSAYDWVIIAGSLVWIALALSIDRTPDAIINPEKLALVPMARLAFGMLRGARG